MARITNATKTDVAIVADKHVGDAESGRLQRRLILVIV